MLGSRGAEGKYQSAKAQSVFTEALLCLTIQSYKFS
jgi:hypothetical protein